MHEKEMTNAADEKFAPECFAKDREYVWDVFPRRILRHMRYTETGAVPVMLPRARQKKASKPQTNLSLLAVVILSIYYIPMYSCMMDLSQKKREP